MNISYRGEACQQLFVQKEPEQAHGEGIIQNRGTLTRRQDLIINWRLLGRALAWPPHSPSSPGRGLIAHGFSLRFSSRLFSFLLAALTKLQEVMGYRKWTSYYYGRDESPWDPKNTTRSHSLLNKRCEPPSTPAYRKAKQQGLCVLSTIHDLGWFWEKI